MVCAKRETYIKAYDRHCYPAVECLTRLETDEGISVIIGNEVVKVGASLCLYSADNLGFYSVFGFLARKFYRLCEETKNESQLVIVNHSLLKTEENCMI